MGKRPRIRRIREVLVKDKTIETLAEFCEVSYNIAFDAYLWADSIAKGMNPKDERQACNNRMLHAQNRIELYKRGLIKKVS